MRTRGAVVLERRREHREGQLKEQTKLKVRSQFASCFFLNAIVFPLRSLCLSGEYFWRKNGTEGKTH